MKPDNDKILESVKCVLEDILKGGEIELVEVVFRREPDGRVLRVLIDRAGGIDTKDCSMISRQLSDVIDVKNVVPYSFKLEVSSPGINRPLVKEKDFNDFIGKTVKIKTHTPINGRKNFKGKLTAYKKSSIFLDIDGKDFLVPHNLIKRANLEYDFNKERK